ncbi:MAG TPA: nuclear transport factor 2 family protein [Acidimicrobiia bacterium]|nr:nuclear transport factor 2 family protein [Acidimicrobiia bacterium]
MGSAEETIRAAAEAYIAGDADSFSEQLHEDARVLGSEQLDYWSSREGAMEGLGNELVRRQAAVGTVTGSLIDQALACEGVNEMGDVALWSTTGDLEIDGYYHRTASWTVVLHRTVESEVEWKIVHSHFSIHR